jgi:hypothetical protein
LRARNAERSKSGRSRIVAEDQNEIGRVERSADAQSLGDNEIIAGARVRLRDVVRQAHGVAS